jgi:hypothetical protein
MEVYVVLYNSYDGRDYACFGVFDNTDLAEQIICDQIKKWHHKDTFTRSSTGNEWRSCKSIYWISTNKLIFNDDISLCVSKEPDHF